MIDFDNTRIAFESKSDADLRRAALLFRTMGSARLIRIGKWATGLASMIRFPMGWAVRPTIYKQFVGAETLEKTVPALEALSKLGVKSIPDYSAEGGESDADIAETYREVVHSVEFAAANANVAFAVFKPSGLTRVSILEKVSMKRGTLSRAEQSEWESFRERFMTLCKKAFDGNIPILVDAEYYCWQDALDTLTEEAMEAYNKHRPIVYATLQMYRHDRLAYLQSLDKRARAAGYIPGIKFVRGAYMEEERKRSHAGGYSDPICPDKSATDENYNAGLQYVMQHIDRFGLFSGTHNEESNRLLASLVEKSGIPHGDPRIAFVQLYGMSDNITFNLSRAGYYACKYVPYAPVEKVLPYLIRRAEENTAIAGQTSRELSLIRREQIRRRSEQ